MVTALTSHIKVTVISKYQAEFSNPRLKQFLFSYSISIENTGGETVQLRSRFWNILDSSGHQRTVEGDGVVGEQPVLGPGEKHEYTSACDLATGVGSMDGYYIFQRMSDGSMFKVLIPRFMLEVPHLLS